MGFIGRLSAIAGGTADRIMSRAEVAVGLREGPPPQPDAPPPHPLGNQVPFFTDDWRDFGESLVKAIPVSVQAMEIDTPARAAKALESDPFMMVELLGYKERPNGLAYTLLEQMVRRCQPIQNVIQVRASQVARHARVQEESYGLGFRIDHRDRKKNLSAVARREAVAIQDAMVRTTVGSAGVARPDFEQFTRKVIYDSLAFDQLDFEVVPSKRGKPYSWKAVDAKSIRLADTDERFEDDRSDRKIRTVQVLDGQVIRQWNAAELCFAVRNPRSSLQVHGYGTSELEMLVGIVTALLWSIDYNKKFFSQGSAPKGLLNVKGAANTKQMAAFRRFFYQMLAGVENAWRTPILNAEQGVEWINMHNSNRDMEFNAWLDFLLKICCSMYLMDPLEIGFKYGNEGDRSLFESANEQKVTQSKDKGLKPLLQWYANVLNAYIVQRLNEDFELVFLGLDALTPQEQADLDKKNGETWQMIDEIREAKGKRPMADGTGQVINSPTWMQYKMTLEQAKLAQQQPQNDAEKPPRSQTGEHDGGGTDEGGAKEEPDLEAMLAQMGGKDDVTKAFAAYEV